MSRSERKTKRKSRQPTGITSDAPGAVIATAPGVAADQPMAGTSESSASPATMEPVFDSPAPASDSGIAAITVRDVPAGLATTDADWPERNWPITAGPRGQGFQVIIKRSVLNAINRHGQTTTDVEVCGVMAGDVYRDAAGPYLRVEAAVRGEYSGNSSAQVTFTAETWNHIQGVMEKDHPQLRVVGWYHTHPGFGIFLSDMDLFIHGNFFNLPWQIALVYDPISGEEGLFIWRDGKTERAPFFVEEDVEKEIVTIPVSAEVTAAALADFSRRMQGLEKRHKTLLVALGFIILIAVVGQFVLYSVLSERTRETRTPIVIKPTTDPVSSAGTPSPATNPALTSATAPTTEPIATTLPAVPTTLPVAEVIHPLVPATMPATRPDTATIWTRVKPLPQPKPDDKPETEPSVIRPNPSASKGPRVLDGPAEQPTRNP